MSDDLRTALMAVANRLVELATEEPAFRSHLQNLLDAFQVAVKERARSVEEQQAASAAVEERLPSESATSIPPIVGGEPPAALPPASPLTPEVFSPPLQDRPTTAYVREGPVPARGPGIDLDLEALEGRCRLKSAASRWAADRRRLLAAGTSFRLEIEPRDEEMLARGKAEDCFLWMCSPYHPSSDDPRQYDLIAGCFTATAEAIGLVRMILEHAAPPKEELESPLHMLAEAQSGLRVAVAALGGHEDEEQEQVFWWLKKATAEMQIYVRRHMKRDDPANPSGAANLGERIQAARFTVEQTRKLTGQRKKLLGKIRHKLSLLANAAAVEQREIWQALAAAVDQLVSGGLPASNKHLRELFLPVLEEMPELPEVPRGFQLFLREIDRYRQELQPPESPEEEENLSADVRGVARLLAGRSILLIGGDPRPRSQEALERAFGLRELIWMGTREHESFTAFEPMVARKEVAVVLLAIRWTSHSYAEVQQYCERYGKPLVRLPGGYSPNQVAVQILMQCSDRLSGT